MRSLVPGRPPEFIGKKKKFAGVFVTVSDKLQKKIVVVLFGKNCLCYPRSGDEGSILA